MKSQMFLFDFPTGYPEKDFRSSWQKITHNTGKGAWQIKLYFFSSCSETYK